MRRLSSGLAAAWILLAFAAIPVVASPDTDSNAPADPNAAVGGEPAPPATPALEAPAAVPPQAARAVKITRIQVDGNQRLTTDAVLHIMSTRVGDAFDDEALRKDFKKIWDRGLLQDLSLETRDDKGGVAVIVHVREKPVVNNVSFGESKVVGESQIEDALKERKATIAIGEPVNLDAIKKAEEGIKSLLGQKGYLDAEVVSEMKPAESAGAMDIHFKIKEGPRTRIRKIEFTGNTVFSDRRLKKTLKLTREHGWFTKMSGKDTYHPLKLDQDMREVENLYHNDGYVEVELKAPVVTVVEEKTSAKPGKGRKWVHVVQPIDEGKQYKVGTVEVSGNSVFTAEQIRKRIPLRQGDILDNSILQFGLDAIEADYGRKGYFYISTNRVINRKADGTADIVVKVSEDKPYKIDRIEFVGNTVTRDNVLRREMAVNEEDLLDIQKVRLGLRRINQLGYFEIQKEPVIKPVEGADKVSVAVEGTEQRRSELQVGGGYSGLDGGFFTSSYQTRNFLGRGDVVSFNAQIGHISTRYVVSYTEPYFLGRPIIFGFSLFRTNSNFTDFNTTASGGSLTLGKRFMAFHSVSASYQLQDTNYSPVTGVTSQTTTSSIRPVYQYDTRNNFFRPSRGVLFFASFEYAGGALGGDNNFIRPTFEVTKYVKAWHRTFWALHAGGGYVAAFGDHTLPTYDRFFLGGERSLRLFETRTVAPDAFVSRFFQNRIFLDKSDCPPAPAGYHHNAQKRCDVFQYGGDKMVVFNAEYVIPSSGPVDLALFLDAGNVYTEEQNVNLGDLRKDAGVELRFFLPVFGAPLRLIYGFNLDPHPHERSKNFVFSIGTTF